MHAGFRYLITAEGLGLLHTKYNLLAGEAVGRSHINGRENVLSASRRCN